MTTHHPRNHPVILMTGTPGTGKSTHAQLLASSSSSGTEFVHINVSDLVKEKGFHEEWDEEWKTWVIDEDKLLDYMEPIINPPEGPAATGYIIEHHSPSLFPERWIDLCIVFTCDNEVLYRRLEERSYAPNKISENVTAEILQTILQEAQESYRPELVVPLTSESSDEMGNNIERIGQWVEGWKRDGAGEGHAGAQAEGEESEEE